MAGLGEGNPSPLWSWSLCHPERSEGSRAKDGVLKKTRPPPGLTSKDRLSKINRKRSKCSYLT